MRRFEKYILGGIVVLSFFLLAFDFSHVIESKVSLPAFLRRSYKLGLDLAGGIVLTYQADVSRVEADELKDTLAGLKDLIERRVNLFGVTEPKVSVSRQGRLIVELPSVKSPEEAITLIGETPFLEFKAPRTASETQAILEQQKELREALAPAIEGKGTLEVSIPGLEDPYFASTNLTGRYLKRARLEFDPTGFEPNVSLEFNDEGGKLFEALTRQYLGKPIAIYLDGIPISQPTVQEVITGGQAQITGRFSVDEAKRLVQRLNQGALPVPIKLIGQSHVSPTLGNEFLKKAIQGGLIGFLLVALFMVGFYRLAGVVAILALLLYLIFNLALYKVVGVTLTLAGISGFVLSIGMAVDANILIFERTREERRKGKPVNIAFVEGFLRAWPSIRDSNVTTLISSAVIYFLTSAFLKGFALTLGIGVLTSMFTAVFVSRLLLTSLPASIFSQSKLVLPR